MQGEGFLSEILMRTRADKFDLIEDSMKILQKIVILIMILYFLCTVSVQYIIFGILYCLHTIF